MKIKTMLSFAFVGVLAVGGCANPSSLTDKILNSEAMIDLSYSLSTDDVEYIPSVLLADILNDPDDDHSWKALHHYRSLTDAGATILFWRDCFLAIDKDPLLFYRRFMKGDEQALFRMVDAMSHDFSAFQDTGLRSFKEVNAVYLKVLDLMGEERRKLGGDRVPYRRMVDFERVCQAQHVLWKQRYGK